HDGTVELGDQKRLGTDAERAVDHPAGRASRRVVGEHLAPEPLELPPVRLAKRTNGDLCVCRHDKLVAQRRGRSYHADLRLMTTTGPLSSLAAKASDGDRQRALALLRRHGWNATSFQILEPGFLYWFDDHHPGDGESAACV